MHAGVLEAYCALVNKLYSSRVKLLDKSCEDIMWFQIDNNSQHVSKPVCLAVVYISPEGSSRQSMINSNIHHTLEGQITRFTELGNSCFIVGDIWNTATYLPLDEQYIMDTVNMTNRSSQDQTVNNFGHVLLDICKSSNLQIVNGRYYKDSGVRNFTCHTANGGHSVVDYLLAPTSDLQSVLSDFEVGDMCPYLLITAHLSFP